MYAIPHPGQIVRVRSRQYLVDEVIDPPESGQMTLVRLSCLDDDVQGEPLEVLWELELDAQVVDGGSWSRVAQRGFDEPKKFSAYLHAQRWNCVTSTNPKLFQAPYRAGIQVMSYQLEPLRKALLLPRVNLFIADDVGLGKTIEAGLILREMVMRQKVRRVVVACPPSVVLQWRDELESRFGFTFVVFDRDYVLARRRERGYAVNPWATHSRFLISHALLRDETYAGPLRDWLGEFCPGSLLILDEAHNAAPSSGSRYAIDSKFTRVVRDLAPRFEHRLFLSATPHNGHSNSFSALLEILDPQRFCRGVKLGDAKKDEPARLLEPVMVRRLKGDLREISGGFPGRNVIQLDIENLPEDAPELVLSRLLDEYRELREKTVPEGSRAARAAAGLVVTSLQKRLLSSIEAFAMTLRVHRRSLERREERAKARQKLLTTSSFPLLSAPPGSDDEHADLPEEQLSAEEEAQMEAASLLSSTEEADETLQRRAKALLEEMTEIAEASRHLPDPRVKRLVDWIREHMCPGLPPLGASSRPASPPTWNERRIVIFTEYADTKRYLEQQLRGAIAFTDRAEARLQTFHGGMDEESREEIKRAFNTDPARHPLRILICTDAAREGVNLQNHCADLFHFDLPWNPSRMEQRNGRIDRKLQRSPEVRCHYFVFTQRPEDDVLRTLVEKTKTIHRELGSLSPLLEGKLAEILEGGIRRREVLSLKDALNRVELSPKRRAAMQEELDPSQVRREALQKQLQSLQDTLKLSKDYLKLDQNALRDALSCALNILGAQGLTPINVPNVSKPCYQFPSLDRRLAADPTWAETLDTLRAPRGKDQKLWEWRKASPIRPVVFEDPGSLDDQVVHLHLEHRVVQRLLGRFLSQGFVHDDLSRACALLCEDPVPRVVLLGRLSLYGDKASRLHNEILSVSARLLLAEDRKQALKVFNIEEEQETIALLEKSLAAGNDALPPEIKKKLSAQATDDVAELLPHLQRRANSAAKKSEQLLRDRGEKEAKEMEKILQGQKKRIEATLADTASPQLTLDFNAEEKKQLEANQRYWQARLVALEGEMVREPARIRASYEVKTTRVEPIGLVYLWPVSG